MTITEFLLARIAEDEAGVDAHGTFGQPNIETFPEVPPQRLDYDQVLIGPARVLAECEAKRRIVELHDHGDQPCWELHRGVYGPGWPEGSYAVEGQAWVHPSLESVPERNDPCDTLRHLAAVYADHPDHRGEWRP